jgi:nicotinate-nucleotide adenylyltransferase
LSAAARPPIRASQTPERARRIALFGGTFDPIHSGHLAVARAALHHFRLDQLIFIPTSRPPHKHRRNMACYLDRFAMVALACAGNPKFVISLAESGADHSGREVFYSVDTVRHFQRKLRGSGARLFFLVGADSFLDFHSWRDYRTLLGLCDFIVASRPGFRMDALRQVIPPEMLAPASGEARPNPRKIALRHTTVHVLDAVSSRVSATEIRRRLDRGQSVHALVPPRVEEYITKQALYL